MNFAFFLLQNSPDVEQARTIGMAILALLPILIVIGLVVILLPFWFICKKAGFSPWLTLLNLVPMGGLVLVYVLAFADWKVVPAPQPTWPGQPPAPPEA